MFEKCERNEADLVGPGSLSKGDWDEKLAHFGSSRRADETCERSGSICS